MKLSIKTGSENYTAQVLNLPAKVPVKGFDRLVKVTYQGNDCLISKDSPEDQLYLFFPSGSILAPEYLSANNLYRHSELNRDKTQTGLIDDSGRVKSVKLKGVISTGLIMPLYQSMAPLLADRDIRQFKVGDSFNIVDGHDLCIKYQQPQRAGNLGGGQKKTKVLDNIVDSKFAPEHPSTSHLFKSLDKLSSLNTDIVITLKLHGMSGRCYQSLVTKKLTFKERIFKKLGAPIITHEYKPVVGSRRTIKSVGFKTLAGKNSYSSDLWTKVSKDLFEGKLNAGEGIYFEIVGKTSDGRAIQSGYSYGLNGPEVYIYRITNINPEGIEVDLSWNQMVARAEQLGVKTVPIFYKGSLYNFIKIYKDTTKFKIAPDRPDEYIAEELEDIFYNRLLEKPSVLDPSVVEEGMVIRLDTYPKATMLKVKSKKFLLHESKGIDTGAQDIEENN